MEWQSFHLPDAGSTGLFVEGDFAEKAELVLAECARAVSGVVSVVLGWLPEKQSNPSCKCFCQYSYQICLYVCTNFVHV